GRRRPRRPVERVRAAVLKYIFGAVFVALSWALLIVFPESVKLVVPVLATFIVLLVLTAIVVIGKLKATRASARFEAGLEEQAKAGAGSMRPDQAAQIAAMQAEFQKAVQSLRDSRKGGDALGTLPIYVIVGPSGAGKSTALQNSGLR